MRDVYQGTKMNIPTTFVLWSKCSMLQQVLHVNIKNARTFVSLYAQLPKNGSLILELLYMLRHTNTYYLILPFVTEK
jgi:hypothetical protein